MTTPVEYYLRNAPYSDFVRSFRKYPMLGDVEERGLVASWQSDHCPKAAHRLVSSHLRLVAKMANGLRRYGIPLDDLISEGCVG